MREIESVHVVTPDRMAKSPAEAIAFIKSLDESRPYALNARYEVGLRYINGDEIRGQFKDKALAIEFLKTYQPVSPKVV
jgi:hypothetical protein